MSYQVYILAGGKSSRMGEDKGLLLLNGKPMVSYILEAVQQLNFPITIITSNNEYAQFNQRIITDEIKEKGPLGGIYTGLKDSHTQQNIFISCDTPFITSALLNQLINKHIENRITIPSFEEKVHPLIGIYPKLMLKDTYQALLHDHLKMRQFIKNNLHQIIDFTNDTKNHLAFRNINYKKDLKELLPLLTN